MKDNVDIRTKDDSDILTLTCFSPQSVHSVTKTWFAQSLNIVPALEATRTLRKARLDLFAAESPSLQGELKRNTSFLWQGERFWSEFRNISRYQLICWFQCGHDNKSGSWRLPRDRQHAGFEDQWWWFHDCGDNFFLYKDNDFVDYNNPQNCSQQHWPTNTFILMIIPPQPGPASSPTYVKEGDHHHHHRHQDCHQRFLV